MLGNMQRICTFVFGFGVVFAVLLGNAQSTHLKPLLLALFNLNLPYMLDFIKF